MSNRKLDWYKIIVWRFTKGGLHKNQLTLIVRQTSQTLRLRRLQVAQAGGAIVTFDVRSTLTGFYATGP